MKYLENVVTLKYNKDKCIGCMRCIEVCPHQVFISDLTKVKIDDRDKCIECGACQMNCPTNAIAVDAGVGCASAILSKYIKNSKWLKRFAKKDCC